MGVGGGGVGRGSEQHWVYTLSPLVRVMRAVGGERAPAGQRVNDRASTEALTGTRHTTLVWR